MEDGEVNEVLKRGLGVFVLALVALCTVTAFFAATVEGAPFSDWSVLQGGFALFLVWGFAFIWFYVKEKKEKGDGCLVASEAENTC